jgi:hypothetical protein
MMPRFEVNLAVRVWVSTGIVAPTSEEAERKAIKKAKQLINKEPFGWIDGRVESLGSMNLSLLDKIP